MLREEIVRGFVRVPSLKPISDFRVNTKNLAGLYSVVDNPEELKPDYLKSTKI